MTNQVKSPVPFNYPLKEASSDELISTGTGVRICTFLLPVPSASVISMGWVSKLNIAFSLIKQY